MVGGGILSRRPGTLSGDGKLLLCPCGRQVHIYSAVTGESVGSLVGHTEEVTGVLLNPENDDQVYSWSMDATVRLWDYRAGEELSRVTTGEPVKYMVVHRELGVAYMSIQLRNGGGRIMLYNLRTRKFSGTALRTRAAGPLALSPAGSLAATIDRHSLFVWRTGTDVYQPLNLHHTKPYTCLAISPDDSLIAAGDVTGRMLIWRAFEHSVPSALRDREHAGNVHPAVQPPLTTLHWHAHAVGALAFSPDGTFLLSGGAEGVLVFWQLETNRPSFLPRLGGGIIGLAPSPADPAVYVVRQADNVVRLVNAATRTVVSSVLGLRPPPAGLLPPAGVAGGAAALLPAGAGAGAGMAGGSGGAGVLVVPCENAQLQFYDVARDRHVQLLQVVPRTAVMQGASAATATTSSGASASASSSAAAPAAAASSLPDHLAPPPPFVSLVAFSADSSVMATVDVRPDAGPYGSTEACLKFWDSNASRTHGSAGASTSTSASALEPFTLNTRVDEPHRDLVASLAYHPRRHVAVTTGGTAGADAEFKVWVRERRPGGGGGGGASGGGSASWRCLSTGGYKGLPLGAAAFSPDGSVLAVAAAAKVTLWDAETHALATVLPPAAAGTTAAAAAAGGVGTAGAAAPPPLTQLAFIPGTPFLAASSPTCLAVYNLLTAAVQWCLPYGATSISADASYGLLAASLRPPRLPRKPSAAAAAAAPKDVADGDAAAAAPAGTTSQPSQPAATGQGEQRDQPQQQQQQQGPSQGPNPHPHHSQHQQQQQQQQQQVPPSCHVLVFDPRDGTPRYHCHVPGAAHVYVAHLQQRQQQHPHQQQQDSNSSTGAAEGSSPLLILRDNRQYSLAVVPGSGDSLTTDVAPRGPLQREEVVSALEAAFGRAAAAAPVDPMDVDGGAGSSRGTAAAAGVGGKAPWAELFDAPSHVLPPPTALANAFLTLLTTDA